MAVNAIAKAVYTSSPEPASAQGLNALPSGLFSARRNGDDLQPR